MKRIIWRTGLCWLMACLLLVSACSHKSVHNASESVPTSTEKESSMTETTLLDSPTSKPTQKPTPKPTLIPAQIATPTPESTPVPKGAFISIDGLYRTECFLTQSSEARNSKGNIVQIPVDEVIQVYSDAQDGFVNETSRFFLCNGEEVFFDLVFSDYHTLYIAGVPAFELFMTVQSTFTEPRQTIELKPWVQQNDITASDQVIIRVDWDRDGTEDEIWFEMNENGLWFESETIRRIYFRSGADGSTAQFEIELDDSTELWGYYEQWDNSRFDCDGDGDHEPLWTNIAWTEFKTGETVMIYRNSSGEPVIMLSNDISLFRVGDYVPKTCFLQFDPSFGFKIESLLGSLEYKDGVFYKDDISTILGDTWTIESAVDLSDNFSYKYVSDTQTYVTGHKKGTYSLQSLAFEVQGVNCYTSEVFPAGTIIIPQKTTLDSSGSGYLYVTLFDGRTARIKVEHTLQSGDVTMEGKTQDELFVCYYIYFCTMP